MTKKRPTVLVYDTETTGLYKHRLGPDHTDQPELVQLAYSLIGSDGVEKASGNMLVITDGDIPERVSEIHGVTKAMVMEYGVPLKSAISIFSWHMLSADVLVGHNIAFDDNIMKSCFHRIGSQSSIHTFKAMPRYCTADLSRPIVKCPPTQKMMAAGRRGWKKPKLSEAYLHFSGNELVGAHDAMVDVRACALVFESLWTDHQDVLG